MILIILLTLPIGFHCNLQPKPVGFEQNHESIKNFQLWSIRSRRKIHICSWNLFRSLGLSQHFHFRYFLGLAHISATNGTQKISYYFSNHVHNNIIILLIKIPIFSREVLFFTKSSWKSYPLDNSVTPGLRRSVQSPWTAAHRDRWFTFYRMCAG